MTAHDTPRDPHAASIMARLELPDHGPEFWERLIREFETVARVDEAGEAEEADVVSLVPSADGPTEGPADHRWNGGAVASIDRSRRRSRLALAAVAAVLAVMAGYSLLRVGENGRSIAPADPAPDGSSSVETTYAHLGEQDRDWAFSDRVVWVDGRFVALTSYTDQEWYWTSQDGISWQRQDGPSELVVPIWAECAPGFSCDVELEAEPLPFLHTGTATRSEARAGDRLLFGAWVVYGVLGTDQNGVGEPADRLSPDLLNLAAENDDCFRRLRDDPDAGTVSGGIAGSTGNWKIDLACLASDQSLRGSFALNLNDYMTPAQAEWAVNPQTYRELWVEATGDEPQRVEGVDDWVQISSSGDRFWMLTDSGELVTGLDGLGWERVARPLPDLSVRSVAAGPGGHVAIQLVDEGQDDTGRSLIVVSHDDGVTWSEQVEVGGGDWLTSVGGAGAAVVAGPGGEARGLLVNGGRAIPLFTQPTGLVTPFMTVGEDRVLVQNGNGEAYYEVFDADGALIHRASADIPSRWQQLQPFVVVTLAMAALAGALLIYRRGRPID